MSKFPRINGFFVFKEPQSAVVAEDMVITREQTIKNGIVCHEAVFKKDVPEDRNKGLKWTDFCVSNLIAVGAADQLKEVATLNNGNLASADSIPEVDLSQQTEQNVEQTRSE